MRANVRGIDDAEAVLDENLLVKGLRTEKVLVLLSLDLFMSDFGLFLLEEVP